MVEGDKRDARVNPQTRKNWEEREGVRVTNQTESSLTSENFNLFSQYILSSILSIFSLKINVLTTKGICSNSAFKLIIFKLIFDYFKYCRK